MFLNENAQEKYKVRLSKINFQHLGFLLIACTIILSCKTETTNVIKTEQIISIPKDSVKTAKVPIYDGVHIDCSEIINGYSDSISCSVTDSCKIYINSKDSICNSVVKLYTVSGILIDSVKTTIFPQKIMNSKPWENGYGFRPTFTYHPRKLNSGVYLWEYKIPFIVKASQSKQITIVYPSNTENAYCESGGYSMYSTPNPSIRTSFLRPILLSERANGFLKWIDETNYRPNINFIADIDLDNFENIKNSQLLIIIGHSEYWTRQARLNFDKFIDIGNDALILSGNTMWWQVRYNKDKNQLICFKSQHDDTTDPLLETINWCDVHLKYPIINSIGGDFRYGGYGLNTDEGWDGFKICKNNSPLLEGTELKKGDIICLPTGEFDGAPLKGFDSEGYPIIDNSLLNFSKSEIIGFDLGFRDYKTCGTFMAFQKTKNSGLIINASSYDWCSMRGIGGKNSLIIKRITQNMINKLLGKQNIFSTSN